VSRCIGGFNLAVVCVELVYSSALTDSLTDILQRNATVHIESNYEVSLIADSLKHRSGWPAGRITERSTSQVQTYKNKYDNLEQVQVTCKAVIQ
jgi:hypothetical protein